MKVSDPDPTLGMTGHFIANVNWKLEVDNFLTNGIESDELSISCRLRFSSFHKIYFNRLLFYLKTANRKINKNSRNLRHHTYTLIS